MEIIDNHASLLYNFQNGSADDLIGSQHINHASSATYTDDGIVLSSSEGLEYPLAKDLSLRNKFSISWCGYHHGIREIAHMVFGMGRGKIDLYLILVVTCK